MNEHDQAERRSFFRIDDEVSLSFRVVSGHETKRKPGLTIGGVSGVALATEFEKMRANARVLFRHIEKDSPDIARYLGMLEDKLDMLQRAVLLDNGELIDQPTQHVNISGSGIAFESAVDVKPGDTLSLTFVLYPTLTGIAAYGTVVSCQSIESGGFRVAVEFTHLTDDDRDLLIRHIVKKQMDGLRTEHA